MTRARLFYGRRWLGLLPGTEGETIQDHVLLLLIDIRLVEEGLDLGLHIYLVIFFAVACYLVCAVIRHLSRHFVDDLLNLNILVVEVVHHFTRAVPLICLVGILHLAAWRMLILIEEIIHLQMPAYRILIHVLRGDYRTPLLFSQALWLSIYGDIRLHRGML